MITFSHSRVSGQYSKAFIQFTSDGQPGEITFEMRYYGTQFNQNIKFFFFSRVIWGREDVHFNHAIFDLTESSDNQNILYFENIDMNENRISGLDSSQNGSDAANKNYVDSEIGKLPKPETDVLKLNGSRAMTGDLDMNNHQVDRVKSIFMNDSSSRLNMGKEASTTLELQLYQVML